MEPTSGSTSSSKLIPYTEGLKREFQAGIKPWIYSLYNNFPEIKKGKSYWSVTPMATEKNIHLEEFQLVLKRIVNILAK